MVVVIARLRYRELVWTMSSAVELVDCQIRKIRPVYTQDLHTRSARTQICQSSIHSVWSIQRSFVNIFYPNPLLPK